MSGMMDVTVAGTSLGTARVDVNLDGVTFGHKLVLEVQHYGDCYRRVRLLWQRSGHGGTSLGRHVLNLEDGRLTTAHDPASIASAIEATAEHDRRVERAAEAMEDLLVQLNIGTDPDDEAGPTIEYARVLARAALRGADREEQS